MQYFVRRDILRSDVSFLAVESETFSEVQTELDICESESSEGVMTLQKGSCESKGFVSAQESIGYTKHSEVNE